MLEPLANGFWFCSVCATTWKPPEWSSQGALAVNNSKSGNGRINVANPSVFSV